MTTTSALDSWRNYFRQADSDIFEIIDHAIMVAAADCPNKFKSRRDRIAELLFSCKLSRCTSCDLVKLAIPGDNRIVRGEGEFHGGSDLTGNAIGSDDGCEPGGSKESKANSSGGDNHVEQMNMKNNQVDAAEALTDEIEEAYQVAEEVLRIKDIILNYEDESNFVLLESLRKLRLMTLSVDVLKATEIGKAVNGLRKHESNRICQLSKTLIDEWKELVDQWVSSTEEIAGFQDTPDSGNPSGVDEEDGLPAPPMDEGVFFETQPTEIELMKFFDGIDDDGNFPGTEDFKQSREDDRKTSLQRQNTANRKPKISCNKANAIVKDKNQPLKRKEIPHAQDTCYKPSGAILTAPMRLLKQNAEQKVRNESVVVQKPVQRKPISADQRRKVLDGKQDKAIYSSGDAKFESAKRKLQQSYQQHETAKRQRTIQVLETIPKQGPSSQKPLFKKPNGRSRNPPKARR